MLKLATILDNPGEPSAQTRYRDINELAKLGYNGIVFYGTTGLSGIDSPDSIDSGEIRRWVAQQQDKLRQQIGEARDAGMSVYLTYDVLSLATSIVDEQPSQYVCRNRPDALCPASDATLERSGKSLVSLINQLPEIDGIVLRFGDNDAARLPYLVGNDIYAPHCPRCSQLGRADRIERVMNQFHSIVVEQFNKRLIARAWNVRPNGLHDSVELCQRVMQRLPGDPKDDRLIVSFKFTQTDFWRYQKWNPSSLVFGDRPIIYELQCQREFEGKGGIPNWQASIWRDGHPETDSIGLAEVSSKVNLAGLWAWVRGGGWGGPFIRNESWIDANVYAVPQLADNPQVEASSLAQQWISNRLGIEDEQLAEAIQRTLENSTSVILNAFYIGPFARSRVDPWHPNADWIQDDLLDAESVWRMIQRMPDNTLEQILQEKTDAASTLSEDRATLQNLIKDENRNAIEPLIHMMLYGESLFAAMRDLIAGLVAYRRYKRDPESGDKELIQRKLNDAQGHWNKHVQRHASLQGTATAFREQNFWSLTDRVLSNLGE